MFKEGMETPFPNELSAVDRKTAGDLALPALVIDEERPAPFCFEQTAGGLVLEQDATFTKLCEN